ncbi:phosphate/phosphite/phosphonate ABC transporter substrate-binding protein [Hoeflea marina]|nr:PhnD/SsuA/transferrin family substrate-binding protein [Hoeflea marina]
MYTVGPEVQALWAGLFDHVSDLSGVPLEVIAHPAPAPLADLWARPDLGAVFMCGYPFSILPVEQRPRPLAAPVSIREWSGDGPCYASHVVVRKGEAPEANGLGDLRWGWTVRDSQSGYNALREYLAGLPLMNRAVATDGPHLNPDGIGAALTEGRIDIGAIDAYAFQLMQMHDPRRVEAVDIIATTKRAPAPMLVAGRTQPQDMIAALKIALLGLHQKPEGLARLAALGLSRFADPDLAAVDELPARAAGAAETLGDAW